MNIGPVLIIALLLMPAAVLVIWWWVSLNQVDDELKTLFTRFERPDFDI